ncbi:hypothetical protein D0Z07_9034 [Hyphodiscus hymeniophilus]|uniref:Small acidic protein n=1 Tax=Hyphodiscus hymeniophilus TaxID=353542 RepID=A0A9P6SKL9_9HELO|nr:hypothetical protein D0Z07_9034 [Hyphodiscus hymeniophilus]
MSKKEKVIGSTPAPEERKRIAAEIRRANKKEKKLIKADAKRQRKQNAIMHRRMTKNPEKYTKNKERNRTRYIGAERAKIQHQAVRQAQQLAAKHDPSGKMFNVGEVVILEDGSVKSKEALAAMERRKAERAAEEEAKKQLPPQEMPKKGGMSKRQQQRQVALQPRPPPPRPVIPEGISLPDGEENFIAMWDITDEQIQKRLSEEKRKKSMARKNLRKQQKAQKVINKAMKLLKRQTENRGEKWDPIAGRQLVMKSLEGEKDEDSSDDDSQASDEADDSKDEDFEIEAASDVSEAEEPAQPAKVEKESKKAKNIPEIVSSSNDLVKSPTPDQKSKAEKSKSLKRPAEHDVVEEPKPKKSKKSKGAKQSEVEPDEVDEAADISSTKVGASDAAAASGAEVKDQEASKEEKRALKEQKRAGKEEKRAKKAKKEQEKSTTHVEENVTTEKSSKKRKHEDNGTNDITKPEKSHKKKKNKGDVDASVLPPSLDKQDSYYSKTREEGANGSSSAAQWNPDALTGEAARKDKFLRLLGAGKANAAAGDGAKHKSTAKAIDISKVQSDLERQYETGMKMKHDGGGKRRGLGA